ncbi:MAG TPA: hypothetical protein VI451_18300 [Anaerolineales bacterium]|nr:hypothetical protein [Anaerolineales bacterium]
MQKMLKSLVLATVICFLFAQVALASWYAGNFRYSGYGVKATIYAPISAPYLETSGESNWVSLPSPNWVQTGWRYYVGYSNAKPYVEYHYGGLSGLTEYGTQSWGTAKVYQIRHVSGSSWCAFIAGVQKGCFTPTTAPQTMLAESEVHVSSNNQLQTTFTAVQYRNSSGTWLNFDQNHAFATPPLT